MGGAELIFRLCQLILRLLSSLYVEQFVFLCLKAFPGLPSSLAGDVGVLLLCASAWMLCVVSCTLCAGDSSFVSPPIQLHPQIIPPHSTTRIKTN